MIYTLASAPPEFAVANAQALLLKVVAVAIIIIGAGIIWAAKKGSFANVIGTVAILAVGLAVVMLGIGFATAGQSVGRTILAFFGF